jgi:TolA-binding protein
MMKRFFSLALTVVIGNILFAQNVDQGRKLHYYERYKGARENFEKTLAANPNNIDAVYWLGQTLLDMPNKDSVGASGPDRDKRRLTSPRGDEVLA